MKSTKQIILGFIFSFFVVACQKNHIKPDDANASPDQQASTFNARLCRAYFKEKKYDQAMRKCRRSLAQNSVNVEAHKWIAVLYQTLDQDALAKKHYKKAVILDPQDPAARNNYGVFLLKQRQYQLAENEFLTAAKNPLYGARELAYSNAGLSMLGARNKDKAITYFRTALAINKQYSPALFNLAKINFENGNYLSASAFISRWSANNKWTAVSLWIALQVAHKQRDHGRVASLGLLLKNQFPNSLEARQYLNSGYK